VSGPAARVPFVGLTGGLGAGKSTALAIFEELGAATLSTDAVVHDLYGSDHIISAVAERLGADVVRDGRVDRGAVARKVFAVADDREWLEGLLWPQVGERMLAWRAEAEAAEPPPPIAVVETPLLFEAGLDAAYDHTIAVTADEDLRAERAGARGHEAVAERAGRQLSQEEKAERADFHVRNDGTRDELKAELSHVLASIRG